MRIPNTIAPKLKIRAALVCLFVSCTILAQAQTDPLPSWNNGPAKQAILNFVHTTTDKGDPNYAPPEQRFAAFDQDGTTWVEHPIYTQMVFAFARIKELAPQHPEWKTTEPFKSILTNDTAAMQNFTAKEFEAVFVATHTGMTVEAFRAIATDWLATARDPRWHRPYTELIYQPMLEVMQYLRANGYRTLHRHRRRARTLCARTRNKVYGIPPEQISSAPRSKCNTATTPPAKSVLTRPAQAAA